MDFQTKSPTTGDIIDSYSEMPFLKVSKVIQNSHQAYLSWREASFEERAANMQVMAMLLLNAKQNFAEMITYEMGKPIKNAISEIEKSAWCCEHYATHAESYLAPRHIETEMHKSFVSYQPLGIVFAIMPWNFPFWQIFRFSVPAIMAGNTVILKHAPNVTGCALAIEKLFLDAGFPKHVFSTVIVAHDVAAAIIEDKHISAVTLTGSDRAGRIVGSAASAALKKIVLELGGNDPYIILEDADLDLAADACVRSRLNNSGQVCIAAKRILAVEPIRKKLQALIIKKCAEYRLGDPLDETIQLGPLAREDLRHTVQQQVNESIKHGAELLLGGKIPEGPGYFYPPTVLTHVKAGMPAYDEEIFGPVFAFIDVKDEEEAIRVANDTKYGLSAAVFTRDLARGERIATKEIQSGVCFVNSVVTSDPRLPFGGIKCSGFGRELSEEGIREFVNVKTVVVA